MHSISGVACLTGFVDAWLNGLIANDASAIPLAPGATIILNDDIVSPRDAFWDQAASVQARIDIANPRWGDTGTQTVITNEDGSQPVVDEEYGAVMSFARFGMKAGARCVRHRGPSGWLPSSSPFARA